MDAQTPNFPETGPKRRMCCLAEMQTVWTPTVTYFAEAFLNEKHPEREVSISFFMEGQISPPEH